MLVLAHPRRSTAANLIVDQIKWIGQYRSRVVSDVAVPTFSSMQTSMIFFLFSLAFGGEASTEASFLWEHVGAHGRGTAYGKRNLCGRDLWARSDMQKPVESAVESVYTVILEF